MRLKFEKGSTPETIAEVFLDYIRQNNSIIGAVNIYIQEYDENMKLIRFEDEEDYLVFQPSNATKKRYDNQVIDKRRSRLRAI